MKFEMKLVRLPLLVVSIVFGFSLVGFAHDEMEALRTELQKSQAMIKQLMSRVDQLETESLQSVSGDKVAATDISSIEEYDSRLTDLEDGVFDLQDRVGERPSVKVFDAVALTMGGFITQQFEVLIGDDDSTASFNATQFELLLRADVTECISVFVAQGFLWEADETFADPNRPDFANHALRVPLILGYVNYEINNNWDVEAGRYITPHGIINIEHFPPTLLDVRQPMFLRPFSGETIFPNFLNGVKVNGRHVCGSNEFLMHAYSGVRTAGAMRRATAFTNGARVAWIMKWLGDLTVGGNYAYGQRERGPGHSTYHMIGGDAYYDSSRFMWKSEIFYTFESGQEDRLGFYVQPAVKFCDKWLAFYRFDYLDDGSISAPKSAFVEHVAGLNFLPCPTVRFRGEVIFRDPRGDDDSVVVHLSSTVSF